MQIFSLLFLQIAQLLENIRSHTTSQTLLYGYKKSSCWKEYSSKRVAIKRSHKNKTISLYNCFILFSHVYLFVFRNDYKISGDTVFLSVILKNLILIIKSHWKSKLSPIELFTFHLSIETHFSRLQQSFFYKTVSQISFNLSHLGGKKFLSDFMRKWVWLHEQDLRFPKNLGSRLKFQKTKIRFCWWKNKDYNDINMFPSTGKPLYLFACKRKDLKTHF